MYRLFYTPMALPLLSELPYSLVIYDCMDALDAFLKPPPLLKQREQELLDEADLVFTAVRAFSADWKIAIRTSTALRAVSMQSILHKPSRAVLSPSINAQSLRHGSATSA